MRELSDFTATGNLKDLNLTQKLSNITESTLITCSIFNTAIPEPWQTYAQQLSHGKIAKESEVYVKTIRNFLYK